MLLILFATIGMLLGTILGHLLIRYKFNDRVNPITMTVKEVNQYEILKEFEEEREE